MSLFLKHLIGIAVVAIAPLALGSSQLTSEFHGTLTVSSADPVVLTVEIPAGDLRILYSRDGQVSITAQAQANGESKLDDNYFASVLIVEQSGNHVTIRHVSNPVYAEQQMKISYQIDVPYRTEVISTVEHGSQVIRGLIGPVKAIAGTGDIKVSYVSKSVHAQVESGSVELEVIGEHADARTSDGNVSAERLAQGIDAETGDGDIRLMVVGPSTATVRKGNGRIDVKGARGTLTGSTDAGDLHIVAVPQNDWKLNSTSGTIRIELPPAAKFDLDAATISGRLQTDRDDIAKPDSSLNQISQRVNGGGTRIEVHTGSGKIIFR